MNRAIVIDTGCMHRLGNDETIFKMVSEQGFKYFDYTLFWKGVTEHIGVDLDYKEKALYVKELAAKYGLKCRQTHASNMSFKGEELLEQINLISIEIEISHILRAKGIVIHPHPKKNVHENAEIFLKHFVPLARKYKINILIENSFLWTDKMEPTCTSKPEGLKALIEEIDDEYVGACIDIGHAALECLETSPVCMLKTLGDKVYALHIHDNDKKSDTHQMPYTGFINFNEVLRALKEIDYKGDITFEIETCFNRGYCPSMGLPIELFPAYVKLEYELGTYFVDYLKNNNI